MTGIACQSGLSAPLPTPVPARPNEAPDDVVVVAATSDGRRWGGWGCCLSWWANQFGNRDDIADALFTLKPSTAVRSKEGTYSLPGLGLTVVRYNIGGSGKDTDRINGVAPNIPSVCPPFKRIQGFWLNWNSPDPNSKSWDWTRDANQRQMLVKAKQRGADTFEAFSVSPLWWMTKNKSAAGGENGQENLQAWNQRDHARYLATVARVAAQKWGITFQSIAPFNEPFAPWWKYPAGQEGCHIDRRSQATVITLLREELNKQGLKHVAVSASDENAMDDAINSWNALNKSTQTAVGQVNVHGYYGLAPYRGPRRSELSDLVRRAGKRLSMSEYGDGEKTGADLAMTLAQDLRELRPDTWCYWQPLDGSNWGLIHSDATRDFIGKPSRKWYVMAQFTRHLRPGMTLLSSTDKGSVVAYDANTSKLVIVTVNNRGGRWATFDMSRFQSISGAVSVWRTDTNDLPGGAQYQEQKAIPTSGTTFRAYLPPGSVQTFEIHNVRLKKS